MVPQIISPRSVALPFRPFRFAFSWLVDRVPCKGINCPACENRSRGLIEWHPMIRHTLRCRFDVLFTMFLESLPEHWLYHNDGMADPRAFPDRESYDAFSKELRMRRLSERMIGDATGPIVVTRNPDGSYVIPHPPARMLPESDPSGYMVP